MLVLCVFRDVHCDKPLTRPEHSRSILCASICLYAPFSMQIEPKYWLLKLCKICFLTVPMLSRCKCRAFGGIFAALRYAPCPPATNAVHLAGSQLRFDLLPASCPLLSRFSASQRAGSPLRFDLLLLLLTRLDKV